MNPISIINKLNCYVCKVGCHKVHHFYDQLCVPCGDFNYIKRFQSADLTGKIALVTGGRVKIGYEVALKLIRCGAAVIITTRFPKDALLRFSAEKDFTNWSNRLHVYSLDFRFLHKVETFIGHLLTHYKHIDILINNAAQTIRKPPLYYTHLIPIETATVPENLGHLIKNFEAYSGSPLLEKSKEAKITIVEKTSNQNEGKLDIISNLGNMDNKTPLELAQISLTEDDLNSQKDHFPLNSYDAHGQQLDLRTNNSWILKIDQVSTVELAEVHLVNSLVPFILASKLKPIMGNSSDSYIINVSSMEGKFSRTKTPFHPHTNMAKAAMNMITRTCAFDYAKQNIYMNSVDTGWITYENPADIDRKKLELGLEPPIDEIDGAARILDPIFVTINTGDKKWGLYWKDYLPTSW